MKHFAIPLLAGAVLYCTQAPAQKLVEKVHVSKEFSVQNASANTLAIHNIEGSVRVEGYDGNKVILEVDKTISAKNDADFQQGKQEFKLEFEQKSDSIIAYIAYPFDSRPNRGRKNSDGPRVEYSFDLDFVVKVPYAMNLNVGTVNGGDLDISDVAGKLMVNNVNGAITIVNAKGLAIARTVNGDVTANYTALPPGESDFKTLNGDIKITYPPALSVDCEFKSFNGEFFTDFPNPETLPVKVVKNEENKSNKTVYKLSTETKIRIGKGGPTYRFETFNGNIYIKKQS